MRDIKDYETLVKIQLTEEERTWATACTEKLLESFNELVAINTDGIKPLITVLDIKNIFREDVVVKTVSREELLSNAPEQYDGYFQVPKTVG